MLFVVRVRTPFMPVSTESVFHGWVRTIPVHARFSNFLHIGKACFQLSLTFISCRFGLHKICKPELLLFLLTERGGDRKVKHLDTLLRVF